MSLNLVAASSQYAIKAAFSPPTGYVVAMGCQFKPTAAATQGILCHGQNLAAANRQVIRNNVAGGVNFTEASTTGGGGTADQASSNLHALAAWNWANASFNTAASRSVHLNGTKTTNVTNVVGFPTGIDEFIVGALDSGGIGNFFNGKISHVWMATAWSDAWDALLRGGADPRTFMGSALIHYWPLASSYVDVVGGTTLAGVNTPTFDTSDQPILLAAEQLGYRTGTRTVGRTFYRAANEDYVNA